MPNHDGGHYFLTVLAPIRVDLAAATNWKRTLGSRMRTPIMSPGRGSSITIGWSDR